MIYLIGGSVSLFNSSILEGGMYLIAACLLTLRPVFAQLSQRWPRVSLNSIFVRKSNFSGSEDNGSLSLQHLPSAPPRYDLAEIQHTEGDESTHGKGTVTHKSPAKDLPAHSIDVEQQLGAASKPSMQHTQQ